MRFLGYMGSHDLWNHGIYEICGSMKSIEFMDL